MNEWTELCGILFTQSYLDDLPRDHLQRGYGCCDFDFGKCMLVSKDNDGLALGESRLDEPYAVAYGTDVAQVRVENIFGPVLSFSAVVTEWPKELKLYSPLARHNGVALLSTTRIALG